MKRRQFLLGAGLLTGAGITASTLLMAKKDASTDSAATSGNGPTPLNKPKAEWKTLLSDAEYNVLFEEGTERPFSSPLNNEKRAGTFICKACNLPLFTTAQKYDSGTGWPSFWQPLPDAIATKTDYKLFVPRTEYHCARCGGHQGHVFKDGPPPTGLRYCNNGVAVHFVPEGETLPELRS